VLIVFLADQFILGGIGISGRVRLDVRFLDQALDRPWGRFCDGGRLLNGNGFFDLVARLDAFRRIDLGVGLGSFGFVVGRLALGALDHLRGKSQRIMSAVSRLFGVGHD
jgi:hypothetical protein